MRTFIAIPLPEECRRMLDQIQQGLRACGSEVRWVAIPSIHLTLKFLGEAAPEIISALTEALVRSTAAASPIELKIRGLGCFPNPGNPRVVWCGIDGETEKLMLLQRSVETVCSEFGFPLEERAFRPHLTLGRVTGGRHLRPLADRIRMGTDLECGFRAEYFNVYKSVLQPRGAVYTVLSTIALNRQP